MQLPGLHCTGIWEFSILLHHPTPESVGKYVHIFTYNIKKLENDGIELLKLKRMHYLKTEY